MDSLYYLEFARCTINLGEILEVSNAFYEKSFEGYPTVRFQILFKGNSVRRDYVRKFNSEEIKQTEYLNYQLVYINGETTETCFDMPEEKLLAMVNMQVEVNKLIEAWRNYLNQKGDE